MKGRADADATGSVGLGGTQVSERERALWRAISRGLKLIVRAIDQYVGSPVPTQQGVDRRTRSQD